MHKQYVEINCPTCYEYQLDQIFGYQLIWKCFTGFNWVHYECRSINLSIINALPHQLVSKLLIHKLISKKLVNKLVSKKLVNKLVARVVFLSIVRACTVYVIVHVSVHFFNRNISQDWFAQNSYHFLM